MKTNTIRPIVRTTIGILSIVGAIFMLQGCSGGGCTRSDNAGNVVVPEEPQDEELMIFSHPVEFDVQSVDEALRRLESGETLSQTETAWIIVTAEASLNHLNRILDTLVLNADNADTWNVLGELDAQAWPRQTAAIVEMLGQRPLDALAASRLDEMENALVRDRMLVEQLTEEIPSLPDILSTTK